jgi:hypothetical protein
MRDVIGILEYWNIALQLICISFHFSIIPIFLPSSAQWVQFKATFLDGGFLIICITLENNKNINLKQSASFFMHQKN